MYFVNGRPRFWIPVFDTVHLAVPALLGLVVVLLATSPPAPHAPTPAPREARAPRPAPSLQILSPTTGAVLVPGQLRQIEGLAPPDATLQLFWFDRPLGQPTRVGPDGRWIFSAEHFPPGRHVLRALTRWNGQEIASQPVIITIQPPAVSTQAPRKKTGR